MLKKIHYDHQKVEKKWQKIWQESGLYKTDLANAKKPYYNLMMYPYPSAEGLHVGNMYAFTGSDVWGRFMRMHGYDVFEPMGVDSGGIHSENFAIKKGVHPRQMTKQNISNFVTQLKKIGNMFDWSAFLDVMQPEYYKWTQWIFTELFKAGLAEKKESLVTWCPSCKTTLSDEQTEPNGEKTVCERCKNEVKKRKMKQWFFKITKYAEQLLNNVKDLDWTEKVKIAQHNWIGRSEGLNIKHQVKDMNIEFEVFDSIPQTYRAQTFIIIAPEHSLVEKLVKGTKYEKKVMDFVKRIKQKKLNKKFDATQEKEGIFTGRYSGDYLGTGKDLPIWVASFAIMEYGTGIVGCSAHDERDFEFAKKYDLPLHPVLFPQDKKHADKVKNLEVFYREPDGILAEPAKFKGRRWDEVRGDMINYLVKKKVAKRVINYHLRDWCISRQRYWGPPIPMIKCLGKCGWQPVPKKELPVLLPDIDDYLPDGSGKAPLARHPEFFKTKCPKCGGEARRETDVSDTFLDSSWYFLRYPFTHIKDTPFWKTSKWLPVHKYIGGAEHSVLHLMYSRFITMALKDMGFLDFDEPFSSFYAHGLIIKDGAKMSKSKGNVVNPDEYISKYGADTLRTYLMFLGPLSQGGDFKDTGMKGMYRFLHRVWKLCTSYKLKDEDLNTSEKYHLHKTIKRATNSIKRYKYNTAIAAIMEYVNFLEKKIHPDREDRVEGSILNSEIKIILLLLAPFVPHMCEELWQMVKNLESRTKNKEKVSIKSKYPSPGSKFNVQNSIHTQSWPKWEDKYLVQDKIEIVVQINGKKRDGINISADMVSEKEKIIALAQKSPKIQKYLKDKKPKRSIYIKGKLVNFVV